LRKYLKALPEIRNIQVGHVVVQISVSDKGELAEGVCVVPGARRPRRMINFVITQYCESAMVSMHIQIRHIRSILNQITDSDTNSVVGGPKM
jgi:hypothetical protein